MVHPLKIPHSRPTLSEDEAKAVVHVIGSGHIAQGDIVKQFENAVAEFIGVKYAAAVSSGTAALHLSLLALGIGPGHEVIIPSFVCTALLNAVNYTGAMPILADIDHLTYNLDPDDVAHKIGSKTRAIIVPHLFGMAADLERLCNMKIPVIEDCAQSIGGRYRGKQMGSFGDLGVLSFYATKVITTGEGGMVGSNSKEIIDKIKNFRDYDNRKDYQIRYNYKMTNIQAAMGMVQLSKLNDFIHKRLKIAERYSNAFLNCGLKIPKMHRDHIFYRYVIETNKDIPQQIIALEKKGVDCSRPVYKPLHHYLKTGGFPNTDKAYEKALSIPIYPSLSEIEINQVIRSFQRIFN